MIAPVSSWAAAVSQYAKNEQYSGLEMFIRAIPYNFYSLLTLLFLFLVIGLKVDYGPMTVCERNAKNSIEPENAVSREPAPGKNRRVTDMLIPVVLLISICTFALIYVGGIFEGKNFISAFSDTDASVALPWGALLTLIIVLIYFFFRKILTFKEAQECLPQGFSAMVPAILILTLATALKNMTTLLEAKTFIAQTVTQSAGSFANFLPAIIFIIASLLAFSTGSSWGTFGILIPIVSGMFPADSPLLFISISACLGGAVCGDHCSPISDTTIMSSAGAGCDHLVHVSTQLPYAITVAIISGIGFLLAGIIQNWFIVFPLTALLLIATVFFFKWITNSENSAGGGGKYS